ncbi:hypothetical protein ABFS83_08G060200 [Erythranthe nasuta]
MTKATTFILIALLFFSLCSAARPVPPTVVESINQVKTTGQVEDSCKGISEDDCLMRRTLTAHLDYIYTQNHNP